MNNICVVGGSGFIGTRLCDRLKRGGIDFSIVDKRSSPVHLDSLQLADVCDIDKLRQSLDGDVIVNLAAEHRDDVRPLELYYKVNVDGAKNICSVASEKGINKIIFTSTVAVYGFAKEGAGENGDISPFNDYGESKYQAERIFMEWQSERPDERSLIIIRPTVIFGENNRGNVYNLLRQISSGRFAMVGDGENRKSMGYVENIAAFIEYALKFPPGIHTYNFIDKPDFNMNELVLLVRGVLGKSESIKLRIPFWAGYFVGKMFDFLAVVTRKNYTISSIRVKKFCANSVYSTAIDQTGFKSPVQLEQALRQTIGYEFIENHQGEHLFYSE